MNLDVPVSLEETHVPGGNGRARAGSLPRVELPGDNVQLRGFAAELAKHLKNKGLYRRDTVVVVPFEEKERVEFMTASAFRTWAERYVAPYKTRHDESGAPYDVLRSMPVETAEGTLACWDFWPKLPNIEEINTIRLPTRKNGKLVLQAEGYEASTKTLSFTGNVVLDETLSLEQATDYLRDLLAEFPFGDWVEVERADEDGGGTIRQSRGQAVHVAAMLSQFARGLVPRSAQRMGFIYNANSPRSGKTLLAKIALFPVNGQVAVQSWNKEDVELRKVLDAESLRGAPYILFDNVKGHMQSQVLEGFMTAPYWSGRVLGISKMFTAPNLASLFVTGNDCTVSPDIGFRCLICNLFVEEALPSDRKITRLIDDAWLAEPSNRNAILSALWAIVRHWDAAGAPPPSGVLKRGYETWGRVIAGMVEFAGFGDCLAEPNTENASDTENEDMRALVKHLLAMDPDGLQRRQEFTFQQIVNVCHAQGLFEWTLDGKFEKDNPTDWILTNRDLSRFGKLLRRYAPVQGRRVFRFKEGNVGMSASGKNRSRRYNIDRLSVPVIG